MLVHGLEVAAVTPSALHTYLQPVTTVCHSLP